MSRDDAATKAQAAGTTVTAICPACGKVRYLTRAQARKAARRFSRRMRAYRCGGFWHLASWGPAERIAWYREQKAP